MEIAARPVTLLSEEGREYVEARYRQLLERLETLRSQIATLTATVQSARQALQRLEKLEGVETVYERAGHILIPRTRDEALEELKLSVQASESVLKKYQEEEREVRAELRQLIEGLSSGGAGS